MLAYVVMDTVRMMLMSRLVFAVTLCASTQEPTHEPAASSPEPTLAPRGVRVERATKSTDLPHCAAPSLDDVADIKGAGRPSRRLRRAEKARARRASGTGACVL